MKQIPHDQPLDVKNLLRKYKPGVCVRLVCVTRCELKHQEAIQVKYKKKRNTRVNCF